jgi:hypothetical protein
MSDATVTETIKVEDYERWGKLIKTWATGQSYFKDDPRPIPIEDLPVPRNLAEFVDQCNKVGVGLTIPDGVKGLTVIQHTADTLFIRLPPKNLLLTKEAALSQATGTYPFPAFYERNFGVPLTPEAKLVVHAQRVGDYTISVCG